MANTELIWKSSRLEIRLGQRVSTPPPDSKTVVLQPGPAFGTGKHPTTRMCLELLETVIPKFPCRHVLDAGCGSGILALAAARLGAEDVVAVEIDPQSARAAGKHADMNHVRDRVTVIASDMAWVGGFYDLILANLCPDCAADTGEWLEEHLARPGLMILSGLAGLEKDRALYRLTRKRGLGLLAERCRRGWRALLLEKRAAEEGK